MLIGSRRAAFSALFSGIALALAVAAGHRQAPGCAGFLGGLRFYFFGISDPWRRMAQQRP
jgi:hypothetical protein